jgi:hypothetical protein
VLPNAKVEKEKVVGKRLLRSEEGVAPKETKVICNIRVQNGPMENIIDLMVVEPSSDLYCQNKPGRNVPRSCEVVNAAASIGGLLLMCLANLISTISSPLLLNHLDVWNQKP